MADLDQILTASTAPGSNLVHGCVVAAVDKNGKQLFLQAAGRNGVSPDAPPANVDATFWIASCSKLIGTIAALQCVERGQITLDEPVDKILPELSSPKVFVDPEGDSFDTRPADKKITLRHLLCHNSGLAYDLFTPKMLAWRQSRGESPLTFSGSCGQAHTTPLLYEPGEGWSYSGGVDLSRNQNADYRHKWAGELVARLNKTTLEKYFQTHIFKPLGMTSTTFRLEKHPEIKNRLLGTAERDQDGTLKDSVKLWPDHAAEDCSGAGLYSSVGDYIRVLGDLIKDEPTLLRKETVAKEMFTAQLPHDSASLKVLLKGGAIVEAMAGTNGVSRGINWGLGGLLTEEDVGALAKGTLAWGGMPNLVWMMNKEKGVAAIFASQMVPPGDVNCRKLVSEVFQEAYRLSPTS
ncbi:hypothetical protein jhhlp_004979 [Lomentospora prolificans]|uniref:Beta-lactamase-related domain-containing protein n=1 Tax=Lomentospora prolificans TaxID=41688 RepID=A0A2N3N824_9PEZI|nr:hypothetical protein jhhlp_004979 [Lomentospora prolificans]